MELINLHYLVYYQNEKGNKIANWNKTLDEAVSFARNCRANGITVYRIEEKRIVKGWDEEKKS